MGWLIFLCGCWVGCFIGMFIMALFQNENNNYCNDCMCIFLMENEASKGYSEQY